MKKLKLRFQFDSQVSVVKEILSGVPFESGRLEHARLQQFKTHELVDSLLLL